MNNLASLRWLALTVPLAFACGASPTAVEPTRPDDPASTTAEKPLAFVDVRVVTMQSPGILANQTVLVRDGVITAIGPTASTSVPADATVIRGDNRVLMPALTDMHVHAMAADLRAYVSHGIANVRNMWGHSAVRTLTTEIAAGTRLGPAIHSASSGLDAPPGRWPVTQYVTTAEQARTVVAAQKAFGYKQLKLYDDLSPAMFDTLLQLTRDNDMFAVGHVPAAVSVRHALTQGMRSIEHLTGYDRVVSSEGGRGTWGWMTSTDTQFASLVQATVAAGTWNCPTLAIFVKLGEQHSAAQRQHLVAMRQRFVKALHDAGAKLLAGSDAGINVVAPGVSLHDELDQFVAAGLSPYAALRIATVGAAEFLERTDFGVLATGKRADLLLIAENPLDDVRRARNIGGVVLAGAWTPQRELAMRTQGTRSQ